MGVSAMIVQSAEEGFEPDASDEEREDYKECLKKKDEFRDKGYRVSDKCYSGTNTLFTAHYCFNYNAEETQQRDIDK